LPTGTNRQREAQGTAENGSRLLPAYISTAPDNDSFLNPSAFVFGEGQQAGDGGSVTSGGSASAVARSGLADGASVWVTLDDSVAVDGGNLNPAATRWASLAFMGTRSRRQTAAAEEEATIGVDRAERHRAAAAKAKADRIRHKIDAMRRILGDVAAFSRTEAKLRRHYLMLAGDTLSLLSDEAEVVAIMDLLAENYTSLKEIFQSHATSYKGKVLCMSANDFTKFTLDAKCLQPEKNWKILDLYHDSMVKEAGIKKRSGKNKKASDKLMVSPDTPIITQSMDFAGFLVAMRNLAYTRYWEQDGGKLSNEQIKELGRNKIKDTRDAVQALLNTSVLLLIDKNAMMSLVKRALGVDEVLTLYYDHMHKLRSVFERYAGADGVADTMTITEFGAMVRDAGIMSMAEAKKVFVLVQQQDLETTDTISGGGKGTAAAAAAAAAAAGDAVGHGAVAHAAVVDTIEGGAAYDDDSLMTFAEFLSGVARIGMWKYHAAGGSLATKIAKAVDVVCALYKPDEDEVDAGDDLALSVSDVTASYPL